MSSTLLYRCFGIVGYHNVRQDLVQVWAQGGVERSFQALPIGILHAFNNGTFSNVWNFGVRCATRPFPRNWMPWHDAGKLPSRLLRRARKIDEVRIECDG